MKTIVEKYRTFLSVKLNRSRRSVAWSVVFLLLAGCERIIDYTIEPGDLNLVINGIINTDSSVQINLSKSIPVLDTGSIPYISDARLSLFENNTLAGIMTYKDNGFYELPGNIPKTGSDYRVVVVTNDGTEASSTCNIPEPVDIISIDTLWKKQYNNYYTGSSYECIITADDPANVQNYYEIKLYHNPASDTTENRWPRYFYSDDPIFEFYRSENSIYPLHLDLETGVFSASSAFFSDELINGKRFSVRLFIESWNQQGTYYFCLRSLTPDYYLYLRSLLLYQMADDNPLNERVQIHTNITNGLGIFGGYSTYTDSIEFSTPRY